MGRLLWCGLLGLLIPTASGGPPFSARPSEDRLAQAITRAQARADGVGGPTVHAFVDPGCTACLVLMERLAPLIVAGQVRVRWIPVQAVVSESPAAEPVRANTALLALLSGSVATPTLAYRTQDGSLHIHVGSPPDLAALLRDAR